MVDGSLWRFEAASAGRRRALELGRRIAPTSCAVLISGPTGVGKDVLAEDIHHNSPRRQAPFVPINCAAIQASLFESELFGHVRGAFTGAVADRKGLAELADGGTLFLDEIGELPLESQAKLLRFLARGTFWPLGGARERAADVRVIAATNRDLEAMCGRTFREDLFFRLCVIPIDIPPLDPQDVRCIALRLGREATARYGGRHDPEKLAALAELCASRPWRGGVREIRNVIERYLLLSDPARPVWDDWRALPGLRAATGDACADAAPSSAREVSARVEDLVFVTVAAEARDVRELATRLGLSVQAVYGRLRRLKVRPQQVGDPGGLEETRARIRAAVAPHLPWLQAIARS